MDASLRTRAKQLAREMASETKTAEDLNGLMMKSAMERMLDTEMDVHLSRKGVSDRGPCEASTTETSALPEKAANKHRSNRRNGRFHKTVQGELGEVRIETPRDRDGTFEPELIGKHQRRVPGFDEKILWRCMPKG